MTALKKAKATVGKRRFAPVDEAPETVAGLTEESKPTKERPADEVEGELEKPPETKEESYTSRLMDAKRRARK
jgi:hypothetical protein